ncbi:co-chaperone GroES [Carboxylicivirga sp. A043]|uniref:co-chaperone GroES n=1 Tax=Carboxylicivirga litoralis TaxID=2816963 RepID=UPI0021CB04A3|nr:co-chaperone GroES family protein [Carboxylicivirga sp. A043]MCU4155473.1 co-chaperone GroES [Carboxylicivirga sp. A043]
MTLGIDDKELEKFILVGDRILLKPKVPQSKTKSGLYLPPSVQEKEKVHSGYIVKVGPGYPIPTSPDDDEVWKKKEDAIKYVPLQPKEGDLAIYLQSGGYEIEYKKEKYVIVSQSAVLMVIRDEGLFE